MKEMTVDRAMARLRQLEQAKPGNYWDEVRKILNDLDYSGWKRGQDDARFDADDW